jgi:hypothetical protein
MCQLISRQKVLDVEYTTLKAEIFDMTKPYQVGDEIAYDGLVQVVVETSYHIRLRNEFLGSQIVDIVQY